MDDRRVGSLIRALRRRVGWHQEDLGARADVSQGLISLLERGHIERASLRTIRAVLRPSTRARISRCAGAAEPSTGSWTSGTRRWPG